MSMPADVLESLRRRISKFDRDETLAVSRLAISEASETFHIDFYGSPFEQPYADLLETLGRPEVARNVASIRLLGPDEGANGTRNWNLEPLLASDPVFDRLTSFEIGLGRPGEHNRTIVADSYDENGVLGRLLASAPQLTELTAPSAPDATFFAAGERPLRHLSIDAGYDTQSFLERLAGSERFPDLTVLEWGEYAETYMEDFAERCTPKEVYRSLFDSPTFAGLQRFVVRNPQLSDGELRELNLLAPDVQVIVVRSTRL